MLNSSSDLRSALSGILKSSDTPVLLCGSSARGDRVTLHVAASGGAEKLREAAGVTLHRLGIQARVKVDVIGAHAMNRSPSLEALLRPLGNDAIIHDPTAVFGRASALVTAAATARLVLGNLVRGVFLDPAARVLYVTMPAGAKGDELQRNAQRIVAVFADAIEAAAEAIGSIQINRPPIRIVAVTELPRVVLVPVDRRSAKLAGSAASSLRRRLAVLIAALGIGAIPSLAGASVDRGAAEFAHGVGALPGLSVFFDGQGAHPGFAQAGFQHFFGSEIASAAGARDQGERSKGIEMAETNFTRPPRTAPNDPNDMGAAGFGTSNGAPSS